jgi:SAM-dependent methyltransferase
VSLCPACGSSGAANVRFSVSASEAAQHFVLAQGDAERHQKLTEHIAALWCATNCQIVDCPDCGLGFAQPFFAGDAKFYNLAYPTSVYPEDKWEFAQTLKVLATSSGRGMRALEIGAGFGHFLRRVVPTYFDAADTTAIEYNDVAAARLRSAGYSVIQSDVRSPAFAALGRRFDRLFMFQVLEHMDGLAELAQCLRSIANPGAELFVAVPNRARIDFNERNASLLDMPPNHVSRWTQSSLIRFAERAGFVPVRVVVEPLHWRQFLATDLVYAHLRRSQCGASIANRVRRGPRTPFRRLLEAGLAIAMAPTRVPAWLAATRAQQSLGGSLWAQLRRES